MNRVETPNCKRCKGTGTVADYVGDDMRCIETGCPDCEPLSTPIAAGSGEATAKAARELLAECDARDTDPVFDESVTRGIRLLCNAALSSCRIGEETEEARDIAWLIERNNGDQPWSWYAENEDDGWHWWTTTAHEAKRFASKAEAEGFSAYRMIASDPTIIITEHVFLRASLSRKTAGEATDELDQLKARVAGVIEEEGQGGAACGWLPCTGCHETNEGYETGDYPFSLAFGCYVGGGCSECGGLGAVWEYISEAGLKEMERSLASPPLPDTEEEAL